VTLAVTPTEIMFSLWHYAMRPQPFASSLWSAEAFHYQRTCRLLIRNRVHVPCETLPLTPPASEVKPY